MGREARTPKQRDRDRIQADIDREQHIADELRSDLHNRDPENRKVTERTIAEIEQRNAGRRAELEGGD